ncbi:MAG: PfkB family carbohydrate kinase [Acidimicrobiales bacterium]
MGPGLEASGGSAANTMAGIAPFGGTAGYIGKVAADQLGEVFAHDMRSVGVSFDMSPATSGPATARCLILVTPDAQRSMNTFLGISSLLEPSDITAATAQKWTSAFLRGLLVGCRVGQASDPTSAPTSPRGRSSNGVDAE